MAALPRTSQVLEGMIRDLETILGLPPSKDVAVATKAGDAAAVPSKKVALHVPCPRTYLPGLFRIGLF